MDFGVASVLDQEAAEAGIPEALEGTLAYISPEQTGRTARGLDARADLYSLGVTLFELLTGQRPFLERDPLALVYAHLAKAPPAVDSLVPGLPEPVVRIVECCLQKHPENRYQTAKGITADLERCLHLLKEHGTIALFPLGQGDFSPKLRIPQTLVSRERESQAISAAFERCAGGAVELLLLSGPSGVGKTALVRSVYRQIAQAGGGLLLAGKHDQLGRSVPYAALAQAFSGLMSSLAASPKPVFEAWRERLGRALGPLARVIADLLPELEWLLGPLPALPVVPTEMMYNRLRLSWIEFVRAVTDASPPLVLFLDDMQWVDPASLELLKTLFLDVGRKQLLLIAAYRDNEVEASHPLWTLVEAVEKSGVHAPRLFVGPLDEASVQTWLAATLEAEPKAVKQLGAALFRKTHGNPFFLGQLLLELYRQKRVRRNLENGAWQWDQDAVERSEVTDNVAELMRNKVEELPASTQELLGQAACAGHSFSLGELVVLSNVKPGHVVQTLWPALQAGLVLPLDGHYREAQALAQAEQVSELDAGYRFLHDRVQQAFYEGIAPEHRSRTHLLIGRRMQKSFDEQGGSNQKQLEMVRHLNLGAAALSNEAEKKELARRNLQGARAAKANGSYRLQAMLVEQGQALLGARAWHEEPQLSVELALEHMEADFMLREFDKVHRRAQELLALPLPTLPRLAAQELRVRTCFASGQYGEGEQLGLAALAEQGIHYPDSSDACIALALQAIEECDSWFDEHPEGFSRMPADASLEHLLCDALEASMGLCAAIGDRPMLAALSTAHNVKQTTMRAALTPVTPFFLGAFANIRSAFLGQYRGDVRWVREGAQAAMRIGSPFLPECSVYRGWYLPYELQVEQSREHYQAAVRAAVTAGSFQGTSWGLSSELYCLDLWAGRPLEQIAAREQAQRDMVARAGDAIGRDLFALAASYVAFLCSEQDAKRRQDKDWLTVSSRSFLAIGNGGAAEYARIMEAHLFLMFGDWERALGRAEEGELFRAAIFGSPVVTDVPLFRGLAAAKCWSPALAQAERAKLSAILDHSLERLRYFSEGCAQNFLHKLRLLEAEQARILGRTDEAMAKYDQAISLARTGRFLHIEALAAQFCAEFHLKADRERIGALYLREAHDTYFRWGALAVVSFLEQQYPALLLTAEAALPAERTRTTSTTSTTTGGASLDVDTAVRAAQALASELAAERVVAKLMRLVQENAGAERALLLLSSQGALSVVAVLSDAQVHSGLAEPLSAAHPIALSIVDYVLRTREPVLLSDAPTDHRFTQEARFRAARVRSVLAVPLLQQGRLSGLLYLEHDTANAFPPARLNLLSVLASQSAIALENARLYQDLQAANAGLEAKVAERTFALNKALSELWAEMDLARKIQLVLLPPTQVFADRYEFDGRMQPADEVGGDYYDAFEAGDRLWLLIGDVSGHGISAGLIMMMVQTAVRSLVHSFADAGLEMTPAKLLNLVNRSVWSNLQLIGRGQYMTMTALCIDQQQIVHAGLHQPLLLFRGATSQVEELESDGCWLGCADDITGMNEDRCVRFAAGDVLLLHTDGLTETRRREDQRFLGLAPAAARFAEACRSQHSCEQMTHSILSVATAGLVKDDISVVVLRHLKKA